MTMQKIPLVRGAFCMNQEINLKSSSGGMFFPIAKYILNEDGVVAGAGFDKDFNVVYKFAQNEYELYELMGSKYVECKLGDTYCKIKEFLDSGRKVLFVGTPCKVYGLKKFLGKNYTNLLTVDFICHGVPSHRVWKDYLKEAAHGREIKNVYFRDKTESWSCFSLKIQYKNGSHDRKNLKNDVFLRGFLDNLYLRPSCYKCKFKENNYLSDITIGDFWGCNQIYALDQVKRGISVVLLRTEKGLDIYNSLDKEIKDLGGLSYDYIKKANSALITSVKPHKNRDKFYKDYKKSDSVIKLIQIYNRKTIKEKTRKCITNIARKILKIFLNR